MHARNLASVRGHRIEGVLELRPLVFCRICCTRLECQTPSPCSRSFIQGLRQALRFWSLGNKLVCPLTFAGRLPRCRQKFKDPRQAQAFLLKELHLRFWGQSCSYRRVRLLPRMRILPGPYLWICFWLDLSASPDAWLSRRPHKFSESFLWYASLENFRPQDALEHLNWSRLPDQ